MNSKAASMFEPYGPFDLVAAGLVMAMMLAGLLSIGHLVYQMICALIAQTRFMRAFGAPQNAVAELEDAMARFSRRVLDSAIANELLRRAPDGYVVRADEDQRHVVAWLFEHLEGRWRTALCGTFVLVECEAVDDANLCVMRFGNEQIPDDVDVDFGRDLPWQVKSSMEDIIRDLRASAAA